MRRYEDEHGNQWDVVVGRESWGAFLVLFVPVRAGAGARQAALRADSVEAAHRELEELDHARLTGLFLESKPKDV